jgi:hypothetical protein
MTFQMSTRNAGAEGRFSSLFGHLTDHALQGIREVLLKTLRQGVCGTDQGFQGIIFKNLPSFPGQNELDTAPVVL